MYNRIRYLTGKKGGITQVSSHNYAKIKIDSYNSVPLGKTITLLNVIILIRSVLNEEKNHYYCNIVLEKCSYK